MRSAQQRTLHRNELLHFQDRWKMCCMLLPCSSLFPFPLGFTWTAHRPATTGPGHGPCVGGISSAWDGPASGRGRGQSEAVEKCPHPPHQYCSATWWKLTLAGIFHGVIGREDRMPRLDTQTLLPVQMMTHCSLHYSWLLQIGGGGEKSVESNWRSRVQLSTSRSCSGSDRNLNVSSCYVLALRRESRWCTGRNFNAHAKESMVIKTAAHNFMLVNCCL